MHKTKDGYNWNETDIFYYLNKIDETVDKYHKNKLVIDSGGLVQRTDQYDFTFISNSDFLSRVFFGSLTEAEKELNEYKKKLIERKKETIQACEEQIATLEREVAQYEQDNSPYQKPSSDKQNEKVGNVRI